MFGLGWQELFLVLLVGGVIYLLFFSTPARRRLTGSLDPANPDRIDAAPPAETPEEILARRFARGEIDETEFEAKRAVIQRNRT